MHAVHTAAALLNTLTHLSPDSALLLLTFAVLLIYVELNRPGWILPGALGLIRRVHALIPAAATLALILGFARLMHGPGDARVHVVTASVCGLSLGVVTSVLTVIARRARTNKRVRLS
jgi:fumarate reductase subunit D